MLSALRYKEPHVFLHSIVLCGGTFCDSWPALGDANNNPSYFSPVALDISFIVEFSGCSQANSDQISFLGTECKVDGHG